MFSYPHGRKRVARMNSESSSSDSDLSDFSVEVPSSSRARTSRRGSISSVSTNPEEDAYVMVLQNKLGLYDNLRSMTSLRDMYDVTFLAGHEEVPIHGVRAVITTRSRLFNDVITDHQEKLLAAKNSKSTLRKAVTKVGKFACSRSRTGNSTLTIPMAEFDPQSFQRLINYIHTGILTVDSGTVVGLLNAGYKFELREVMQACWNFALGCVVREDNMRDLFESAKRYKHHQMTGLLMNTIWSAREDYPSVQTHASLLEDYASPLRYDEVPDRADCTGETDGASASMLP